MHTITRYMYESNWESLCSVSRKCVLSYNYDITALTLLDLVPYGDSQLADENMVNEEVLGKSPVIEQNEQLTGQLGGFTKESQEPEQNLDGTVL